MGRLAVIGEHPRVVGYELAGALVLPAEGEQAVRAAWDALPADVAVVILSPAAAALVPEDRRRTAPLRVEMPQ